MKRERIGDNMEFKKRKPLIILIAGRARSGKSTFGHGKIIDRIQKICLAFTIITADAVDIRRELQFLQLNVPEV